MEIIQRINVSPNEKECAMKKLSMLRYAALIACIAAPAYATPNCGGHGCSSDNDCHNYAYEQDDYRYLHCTNMGLEIFGRYSCCDDPAGSAETEEKLKTAIKAERNKGIVEQAQKDAKDKADREAAEKAAEAIRNGTPAGNDTAAVPTT